MIFLEIYNETEHMSDLFVVAVAFLINRGDEILIGKRSDDKKVGPSKWELPAGRLKEDESIEEGIQREGSEELGVKITPIDLIDTYTFRYDNHPAVLLCYHCNIESEPIKSNEHQELRWEKTSNVADILSYTPQQEIIHQLQDSGFFKEKTKKQV